MDDNKLAIKRGHIDALNAKKIVWNNLIGGLKNPNAMNLYNCNYSCPPQLNDSFDLDMEFLVKNRGVIEYIDTDESDSIMLKNTINDDDSGERFSHCEIHSSLIMGFIGFTIPFVNTSQAPRNVYGTGQTKQSVGMYVSNFKNRFDTSAHVLFYPEKPLIGTRMSDYVFANQLPTGKNAIVAIASYSGYNQDDSVIINKSALERGLFRSAYFKTYSSSEMTDAKTDMVEFFYDPNSDDDINNEVRKNSLYNYQNTDERGFAKEGTWVSDNDVLITKYVKTGSGANVSYMDHSEVVKQDGWGVVDKVFSDSYNSNGEQICKVRVCTIREPTLGDKFASRHGQKGVIGMILREEDMPYTKEGIRPDIIINPHAIPSRMTLGQLLECVSGKMCCDLGCFNDATPFTNIDHEEIYDIVENVCGYSKHGDEILYSGINGKQLSTKIFIGPTYYQRLKHMVKDKINSRSEGKMSLKTHQPPAGRAVGGGLRIGEMERDAILSHGALYFLKETMMERSDKHDVYISENSGLTGIVNNTHRRNICQSTDGPVEFSGEYLDDLHLLSDNSNVDIVKATIPYNTALLGQECMAMGISMRLVPKPNSTYKKIRLDDAGFIPQDLVDRSKKQSKKKGKVAFNPSINPKNDTRFVQKMKGNKITIKNLSDRITENDCKMMCEQFGLVYRVNITKDYLGTVGEVVFTSSDAAEKASNALDKRVIDDVDIWVEVKNEVFTYNPVQTERYYPNKKPNPPPIEYPPSPGYNPDSPIDYPQSPKYNPDSPIDYPQSPKYPLSPRSPTPDYRPSKSPVDYPPYQPEPRSPSPDYGPPKSPVEYPPYQPQSRSPTPDYRPSKSQVDYPPYQLQPRSPSPDYGPSKSSEQAACEKPSNSQAEPAYHNNSPQNPGLKPTIHLQNQTDELINQTDELINQTDELINQTDELSGGGNLEELTDLNSIDLSIDLDEIEI
jgi:hypothetical protein